MPELLAQLPRLVIDGTDATPDQLRVAAVSGYGHFTSMQVRGRRVRGLDRHIARLRAANSELFGADLEPGLVRDQVRFAIGDLADATVRVLVIDGHGSPSVMVTVRPPGEMQPGPWKLRSVPYQRTLAHIKHLGDFGQSYYQRLAHASGFEEALLTGPDGLISEGSVTNVGFLDGAQVVWPAAPALAGVTMQLVESGLSARGVSSRRTHVRVADLHAFTGVFVTNARGIAAVSQVDDSDIPVDQEMMRILAAVYDSAAWDEI
jgi:branched-subunit amino acid aminotransferase/4-amino-4-deoxychorismate lyase